MTVLKHSYSKVTDFEIIASEDLILMFLGLCFWNAFSQLMATDCGWYIKRCVWTEKYQMNQKSSNRFSWSLSERHFEKNNQMTNCSKKSRNQSEFQDQWKRIYEVPRVNESLKLQSLSELSAGTKKCRKIIIRKEHEP